MATTNLNEPTSSADGNIPYIGAAADDGTGNTLREAISRINARLRELYGSQDASNNVQTPFVDNDNIKDGVVSESKLSISNSPANGQILSWDDSANQFVWKNEFDGDITSIVAGLGLTGTSLDTDDATLNIGAGTGITVNADDIQITDGGVDTTQLAADSVSHSKLEDRYTAKVETNHATGAYTLDWEDGTTWEFTATLTANIELDFTNFKQGQVIDIYGLTGDFTITLDSDAATSETFNKVGGVDYDGTSTNHLQVVCLDDSADAVFNYTIATYESDTTPS